MHEELINFLIERRLTSQFILNSIKTPEEFAELHESGRLQILRQSGSIVLVCFISSSGRLHLQGKFDSDIFSQSMLITTNSGIYPGINGPGELMQPLERWLLSLHYKQPSTIFRDTVFTLSLLKPMEAFEASLPRLLTAKDFIAWHELYVHYLREMGINSSATADVRKVRFESEVSRKMHWGLEVSGRLVSIAAFNSLGDESAQVGGVFTAPEYRRLGYSELAMKALIRDAMLVHGLKELILYTGAADVAPFSLYLKLGFKPQCEYWSFEFDKS